MSNRTREINKITTTIISISVKLIVYALIKLLLYEAVARGYAFGHEIFFAEAVEDAPGTDVVVQISEDETVSQAAEYLAHKGLIKSEFAFIFQSKFYDYDTVYPGTYTLNTSMTSKEILQLLNEKPETEDVSPAQSGNAKAKTTAQTTPAAAGESDAPSGRSIPEGTEGSSQGGTAAASAGQGDTAQSSGALDGAAAQGGETAPDGNAEGRAMSLGEEARDSMANQESYEGEDQEMEGGWIEDAAEE